MSKSSADKRLDNMPSKLTAHAVRRLCACADCGGVGDGTLMIHDGAARVHTSCYAANRKFVEVLALPASERNKFRLCDVTPRQMQKLMVAPNDR